MTHSECEEVERMEDKEKSFDSSILNSREW